MSHCNDNTMVIKAFNNVYFIADSILIQYDIIIYEQVLNMRRYIILKLIELFSDTELVTSNDTCVVK